MIHYLAKRCFLTILRDKDFVRKDDANIQGYCGMAPVHFAARYGTETEETKETIDFLMNQMDNPHLQDEFGNTVLHHSILNAGEVRYIV